MNIDRYKILISNLTITQQSFTTMRTTWLKAENEISWLKQLKHNLFGNQPTLTISRQEIFETENLREQIIKIIYWGYTGGMRGNHFVNILKHIELLEYTFKSLKQNNKPTTDNFNKQTSTFKGVTALGLSNYRKLIYFLQLTFNDNPCLILDQRLIDVFSSKTYFGFQPTKRNSQRQCREKKSGLFETDE